MVREVAEELEFLVRQVETPPSDLRLEGDRIDGELSRLDDRRRILHDDAGCGMLAQNPQPRLDLGRRSAGEDGVGGAPRGRDDGEAAFLQHEQNGRRVHGIGCGAAKRPRGDEVPTPVEDDDRSVEARGERRRGQGSDVDVEGQKREPGQHGSRTAAFGGQKHSVHGPLPFISPFSDHFKRWLREGDRRRARTSECTPGM